MFKLTPYTLKRYEPNLKTYFFYNARRHSMWSIDAITGSVIASLDGTNALEDIINEFLKNNSKLTYEELNEHFSKILEFLLKEDFVCEYI